MLTINTQKAEGNSKIFNAEEINNIIYDNPLKFFCDKKITEEPELDNQIQVIYYVVNNDIFKIRFGGNLYKYEELVNRLSEFNKLELQLNSNSLDDGYKSIIQCIVKITSLFKLTVRDNKEFLEIKGTLGLVATIENMGLKINYNKEYVNTFEKYVEAKESAEKIKNELAPYINCASQYGNYLQFNNIYIDKLENVPFITKEVKFKVSNSIIPNLIKPLYSNSPECGLREIIQNACDACKEAALEEKSQKYIYKTNNHNVKVYLNKKNEKWEIIIRDLGIGMNQDILLEKYFVIGESTKSKTDLNLVGQFGIGALAAFLLGDEIKVRTKYLGQDVILSFQYKLEPRGNGNISVNKSYDDDFVCGTEISIKLNDTLAGLDINDLESKLMINDWYVLSDVQIEYYINDKMKKMNSFNGNGFIWEELINEEKLKVNYLQDLDCKNNLAKIIYNGIVVPDPYQFKCKYIIKKPYISIKSWDKSIKLNLGRSKIESGLEPIINKFEKQLIALSLDKLKNSKIEIVDEKYIIKQFKYNDNYMKSIPLFFCKDGFGIYSKETINSILYNKKYNTIIRVYGYNGYPSIKITDLHDEVIYLFDRYNLPKSQISDLIESTGIMYIPVEIVKRYFYDATSQYNGFREKTMIILYKFFSEELPSYDCVNSLWEKHNQIKKEKFEKYFSEPEYILINSGIDNNCDVENLKSKCKNAIIKVSNLNDSNYSDIVIEDINVGIV